MNAIEIIKRDGILTEEEQFAVIDENVENFRLVKNQTEAAQHKAVLKSISEYPYEGYIIEKLEHLSDDFLIEAMERTMGWPHHVFAYIKNPSDRVQIRYIELSMDENSLLSYVPDPSPEVLRVLIEKSPPDIENVKNPSKELQQLAIKNAAWSIVGSIKDLDYDIQLSLLSEESEYLEDIQNPCLEVLRYLATQTPAGEKALESNILEIQMMIVQTNPSAIGEIENPLPEVIQWVKDNC
jgi:hypothetical protein